MKANSFVTNLFYGLISVKFVLLPTAQVATMKCALNQSLAELKEHFAVELKIPANVILLLYEGENRRS